MPVYQLSITFRSNEHPFSTIYDPYPQDRFGDDDDAALAWGEYMEENLPDYAVTLLRDGTPITR